ncbi:MAG: hypothetical protein GQ564_22305 [Bacteroidales bacterium]|nr:hypothetical protein [Bacteroidales bacterium]
MNQYAEHLNEAKQKLRLKSIDNIQLLAVGDSNFAFMPTRNESGKKAELITKYSEALTEINPYLIKESYSIFKYINVAIILATGILFFNIGRRNNNNIIKINQLFKFDRLSSILEKKAVTTSTSITNKNISSYLLAPVKMEISYIKPNSIFDDNVLITANSRHADQSLLKFKGIDGISKEINGSYDNTEIHVYEGDQFYFKYQDNTWMVNVYNIATGADIEIVKKYTA